MPATNSAGSLRQLIGSAVVSAGVKLQDVEAQIKVVVADLGFRGVDADNPNKDIIYRGKFKTLSPQQRMAAPAPGRRAGDRASEVGSPRGIDAGSRARWAMRCCTRPLAFLCLLQMVLSAATALRCLPAVHGDTRAVA